MNGWATPRVHLVPVKGFRRGLSATAPWVAATTLLLNLRNRVPRSRCGFPFVDGLIDGIQVSPCAGIDNVRAGRLPAKTLAFEVNVDKNLADGILSTAYRMHGVVNQPSRQRRDSIDSAIDRLNGTISIGGFNERGCGGQETL